MNLFAGCDSAVAYRKAVKMWCKKLADIMSNDPIAPTSILTFFLCDSQQGMFCPLGCEEYEKIGDAMRLHGALFAAAEKSGLFASAIPTYVDAALDNYNSWCCLNEGVAEILASEALRKYLPFTRTLAAALHSADSISTLDEDEWQYCRQKYAQSLFKEDPKGYSTVINF